MRTLALAAALSIGMSACPSPTEQALEPRPVAPPKTEPTAPERPDRGKTVAARLTANLTPYIDAIGATWGEAFRFSGLVAVAVDGKLVYSEARGYRDRAGKKPIDADTSFRVGSVTKQFTAAAILELEERGKLATTDTVRKHLPDYPKVGDKITVHHLLTHTSGVPSYTSMPEVMKTADRRRSVAEMVALFAQRPLEFDPGSEFRYSNSNYVLLGAIIEKASGQPYGAFVEQALFKPAGLTATTYGDDPQRANRALGYTVDDSEALVAAKPIDMSVPYAAGGVRSTAADLVRWDRALAGNAVLGEAARRKMVTAEKNGYAYGWRVGEASGKQVVSHGGAIFGFDCSYVRIPEDDIVIVVWSNNETIGSDPIAAAAVGALAGDKPTLPVEPRPAALEAVNARRVVGGYVLTDESRGALGAIGLSPSVIESVAAVFIRRDGEALFFDPIGSDRVRLHARAATANGFQSRFFAKRDRLELEFSYSIDDEGKRLADAASGLLVEQQGVEVKFGRNDRAAARLEAAYRRKHPKTKKR